MKAITFDVETTGLKLHNAAPLGRQPHIVEFGGVLFNDKGETLKELSILIKPPIAMPKDALEIHNITDEMLARHDNFEKNQQKIQRFLNQADLLIAHNLDFDFNMLLIEFTRLGMELNIPKNQVCTAETSQMAFGHRLKLSQLYYNQTGKKLEQTHRALDDARALAEIAILGNYLNEIRSPVTH